MGRQVTQHAPGIEEAGLFLARRPIAEEFHLSSFI
jgi:hypothetical protein